MYLTKKTYVKRWEHQSPEHTFSVDVKKGGVPVTHIKPERVMYVEEEVMYWRKANQIHNWFVNNVQDGKDDCGSYYVSFEQIKELYYLVQRVRESQDPALAKKLLPPVEGFFFGSVEIDDWYWEDLKRTEEGLLEIIELGNLDPVQNSDYPYTMQNFGYQSSW